MASTHRSLIPSSPSHQFKRLPQLAVSCLVGMAMLTCFVLFQTWAPSPEPLLSRQASSQAHQTIPGFKIRRVLDIDTSSVHARESTQLNHGVYHGPVRWEQHAEKLYQRGLKLRYSTLKQLINHPFDPWDIPHGVYIWDWFAPDFTCPTLERVGRLGDGGKWICDIDALEFKEDPCIVYSFGVRDDVTFEQEVINRSGGKCTVHAFDPSVGGLPHYAKGQTGLHYHKAALAAHTNEPHAMWPIANSLLGHMQALGHTTIDVLKIDCEGCEWDVFDALLESDGPLPFNQLLIELHLDNATGSQTIHDNMFQFFEGMEARGFRAYAREVNIGPTLTGQLPVACEYSFIRNQMVSALQPASALVPALMAPKLKAGIYVLLNAKRLSQLTLMLQQLHDNFNKEYEYPIVLFHDVPISESTRQVITRNGAWPWVRFKEVELSLTALEPDINPDEVPEVTECAPTRLFYRHMCRFHSVEASRLMSEMGFEWHWRLDDDSRLSEPVGYDVFQLMATNNMLYSYLDIVQEEKKCYTNLWDLAELHLKNTHAQPTFYHEWPEGVVFYNNFEISHQLVWQSPEVSAWMHAVRESRGIYLSRWGDAPIRTLAVAMFVDPMRVHRFSDLAYSHAPLFKQSAASLPGLGLGAVQSALCSHIKYWDLASNASAAAQAQLGCTPLIRAPDVRFHLPSEASNKIVRKLGDGMMNVCSPTHLTDEAQERCALPVTLSANPPTVLGEWQLSHTPAPELNKLLSIHKRGMLGTDIATTIPLPAPKGTKRTLWLLGDTPWGAYDEKTCARKASVMPRNALAVTTDDETCFHLRQGKDLLPVDLLQPPAKNDPKLYQQHWWWLFAGLTIDSQLFLLGADFWLAPHTMWYSQGTLVFVVSNPEAPVHEWTYTKSYINKHPGLHWYGGVAKQDEWVYLVGSLEDDSVSRKITTPHGVEVEKGLVLSRIRATDFAALEWSRLEFWSDSWSTQDDLHSLPPLSPILYHTGGGETTLQWDDRLQLWYMLFVQQQDRNKIMLHYSSKIEGLWKSVYLYSPAAPFTDTENYMCYAVKAHPGLAAESEIVFSFVCTKRPWTWPGMTNVYVPQFVRMKLSKAEDSSVVSIEDTMVESVEATMVEVARKTKVAVDNLAVVPVPPTLKGLQVPAQTKVIKNTALPKSQRRSTSLPSLSTLADTRDT